MTSSKGITGRRDVGAIGLLLGLTAIYFADVLFFAKGLFIRDLASYYYPTKKLLREVLLRGELPLWNWAYSAGQPMAANPEYGVFYPPHLLLLLPDYDFAFQLLIILHVAMAAVGAYRLLRSMELRVASSLFGAMTYAFGGLFASLLNLLPYLFILTWLPWAFYHVRKWLSDGSWRDLSFGALFLGLQILTAEPSTLIQVWLLLGLYALFRVVRGERETLGRVSLRVGLLLFASVAVGSIQLLPAIDHVGDSVRSQPFSWAMASSWSMPPFRPLELMTPAFFGRVWREGANAYWGAVFYAPRPLPFLFSLYMGILGFCVLIAGLRRRIAGTGLFLAVCAVSYLLALGANTPLLRLLYDAGIATSFRYTEKFAIMGLVAIVLYQARAFDRLLQEPALLGRTAVIAAALVLAGSSIVVASLHSSAATRLVPSLTGIADGETIAGILSDARHDWLMTSLHATIALVLFFGISRMGAARALVAAMLCFAFVDLAVAGRAAAPGIGREFFSEPATATRLDADRADYRIFPLADWFDSYGRSENGRRFAETGSGVYWTVRNGLSPNMSAAWSFNYAMEIDYDRTALLPTARFVDAMWKIREDTSDGRIATLSAMANARYWTRFRDYERELLRSGSVENASPVEFVRLSDNPRYYFADRLVTINSAEDFTRQMIGSDPGPRTAFVQMDAFEPKPGRILAAEETARSIRLKADATGHSFMVLSVTPHKYWRAWVDGQPVKLVPTNLGFQGVVLESGQHDIELEYRNPMLVIGGEVTVVATLVLLSIAALSRPEGSRPGV